MKTHMKNIFLLITVAISLSGCFPTISKRTAEKELVAFMLDYIVLGEIGGTADYIENSNQPWVDEPPASNIIVYAPPLAKKDAKWGGRADNEKPIRVWLYGDGQLVERADKKETIANYEKTYMDDPKSDLWAWGYYDFSILSLSKENTEAEVYVGAFCGPLCGHGRILTLRRNDSGKWEIHDSKRTWIS